MRKTFTAFLSCVLVAVLTINVQAQNKKEELAPREKWELVEMQGTITAIDKQTREVTLTGAEGELLTITASDEVQRFDEFKVGDVVTFGFWTYIMAEFREPTKEEMAEPLVVLAEAGKAPEGVDPGAMVGAVVRAVVTIEVLNRPFMLATVKGPAGNYVSIEMEDEALMQKLHIGQVVIITYAEAVAVTLEHVN